MADMRDLYYHGVRHQIRRVLTALGPERIEKGLTAFEDGDNNWASCFFARAFDGQTAGEGNPERWLMTQLKIESIVPIRIVWNLFDQLQSTTLVSDKHVHGKPLMTKDEMRKFIESVLDESRSPDVLQLLRSLSPDDVALNRPVEVYCG